MIRNILQKKPQTFLLMHITSTSVVNNPITLYCKCVCVCAADKKKAQRKFPNLLCQHHSCDHGNRAYGCLQGGLNCMFLYNSDLDP